MCKRVEDRFSGWHIDAFVGDALPVSVISIDVVVLTTCHKVTFQHDASDALLAFGNLFGDVFGDRGLTGVEPNVTELG